MEEQWKAIPGYEGLYEASSLGRIRSVDRMLEQNNNAGGTSMFVRKGRVLAQRSSATGYFRVNLSKDNRNRTHAVHRLICRTFRGEPISDDHEAAHNDGKKANNQLSNLRWATPKSNTNDKRAHGTLLTGERHSNAKLNWNSVREIRASNDNAATEAERHGVGINAINKIRQGKTWRSVA